MVRKLGVDYAQGFLLGGPEPIETDGPTKLKLPAVRVEGEETVALPADLGVSR